MSVLTQLEILDANDPASRNIAAQHLAELGHVAFTNILPAGAVDRARHQLDSVFPIRLWRLLDGQEEIAVRSGLELSPDDDGFGAIRGAMFRTVASLDGALAPADVRNPQNFDQLVLLQPGRKSHHQTLDEGRGPILTATTLDGTSRLVLDEGYYPLEPGVVVLIDGHRRVFHEEASESKAWLGYFATLQTQHAGW